tara:strand:- start:5180 stop:7804 length:2625 start_codon:yes stop_codon:yes gene_type:complete
MADRLNLFTEPDMDRGLPVLNEPDMSPPDTSGGFNITGSYRDFFTPETISQEQYRTGFVDFVNQTLASTGVGVDKEKTIVEDVDRTGDVGITRDSDSGSEGPGRHSSLMGQSDIRVSTDGSTGDGTGTTIYDMNSVQFKSAEDYNQYRKELKQDRSGLFSKEKIGAAAGSVLTAGFGMNPILSSVMSGLTFGDTVKSPTGNTAFRPAGALGYVTDFLHSQQSKALTEIQAAHAAGLDQKGFALDVGGKTLIRKPGKFGYIGNLDGLSLEYLHAQEAYSKGLSPDSYNPRKETGQSFEETGGVISGTHSHYNANGTFYNAKTGTTSRYGNLEDLNNLAAATGLSGGLDGKASQALEEARSGKKTLAQAIRDLGGNPYKIKNLDDASKAGLITSGFGVTITGETTKSGPQAGTGSKVVKDVKTSYADFLVEKSKKDIAEAEERKRQEEAQYEQQQRNIEAGQQRLSGDFYSDPSDEGGPSFSTGSAESAFGEVDTSFGSDDLGFDDEYAAGGTVGMAAGGAMAAGMGSGFVDRPPSQVSEEQTVADNVETQMPEGAFVINAAAVEFAGEQDIKKMLNDAQKEAVRRGITIDNSENSTKLIDVAISRGEVTVAPYLAKIIGYDRLNKINNRGKPEVAERQREAARGGMLGMAVGGTVENYEDPIILNEVRRKMDALISSAEKQGVSVSSYYEDPLGFLDEEQANKMAEITKNFVEAEGLDPKSFGPFYGTDDLMGMGAAANVPRTPTLFNLFVTAEELAHALGSRQNYDALAEQPGMTNEEARYNEEVRAKQIAYETVRGLLPQGKETAQFTLDNYSYQFLDHIRKTTPKELQGQVLANMAEKYPELQSLLESQERTARSQRAEKTFQTPKAMGGFI